jgi:hypothetical protein
MEVKNAQLLNSEGVAILAVAVTNASSKSGLLGHHAREDVNLVPLQLLGDRSELVQPMATQ